MLCISPTRLVSRAMRAASVAPLQQPALSRSFFSRVNAYETALHFKQGVYAGTKEPGMRLNIPVFNSLYKVDMRVKVLNIPPQGLMTRDNVSIQVDAVAFYKVVDAKKAALAVEDFEGAVGEAAQTTLRAKLCQNTFDDLLTDREEAGNTVLLALHEMVSKWGLEVDAVKLKNISIDPTMVRAMARRAEAMRLKEARAIEAQSELETSAKLAEAARIFGDAPLALRLRELQTYAQIAAEKNTVLIPANMSADVQQSIQALRRSIEVKEAASIKREKRAEAERKAAAVAEKLRTKQADEAAAAKIAKEQD